MSVSGPNDRIAKLEGTIVRIDPLAREVLLQADDGSRLLLVVPPDCIILLHGERVKLRLLQHGDNLLADCSQVMGKMFAHSLRVRGLCPASASHSLQELEGGGP